jgi:hypothetical protein
VLGYTHLNYKKFANDPQSGLDADDMLVFFVQNLKGTIKSNYIILAPAPSIRVLYFEMEDGAKAELIMGSQKDLRDMAKQEIKPKKEGKK